MGASVSKSTLSKNHLKALNGKQSKRASIISPSSSKIEPSENIDTHKKKKKNKLYSRKSKKQDISKSIIGRPTNFMHLNHAGIDYTSMDTLFMPIEEAQHLKTKIANTRLSRVGVESAPNCNYNSNRNISLTMKDYTSFKDLKIMTEREASSNGRQQGAGSLKRKPINYAALFSDELYAMTHENNSNNLIKSPVAAVY
ncbi:hypothetical protein HMPREF1544_02681 [Mucor circinelloides 1006PhL]|uniref:CRIB domain-containing protein n=1 Tax=Mucor circinelloides f. circinelloides (strain 1006PhL) TaxID=1220926 RepID=S2JPN4_MUCC1|nr:hypothetical protein HMPREF1544_02681 [Mucor circinelloides 1006PhL]KAG1091206.1 hypothetical protein G6F42_019490 [Rhizopus arrhizus]